MRNLFMLHKLCINFERKNILYTSQMLDIACLVKTRNSQFWFGVESQILGYTRYLRQVIAVFFHSNLDHRICAGMLGR